MKTKGWRAETVARPPRFVRCRADHAPGSIDNAKSRTRRTRDPGLDETQRRFPFEQLVGSAELQRLTNDGGNFSQEESLFEAERSYRSLKTGRNCLSRRTMARPML